jgi:hypothetical protein
MQTFLSIAIACLLLLNVSLAAFYWGKPPARAFILASISILGFLAVIALGSH